MYKNSIYKVQDTGKILISPFILKHGNGRKLTDCRNLTEETETLSSIVSGLDRASSSNAPYDLCKGEYLCEARCYVEDKSYINLDASKNLGSGRTSTTQTIIDNIRSKNAFMFVDWSEYRDNFCVIMYQITSTDVEELWKTTGSKKSGITIQEIQNYTKNFKLTHHILEI